MGKKDHAPRGTPHVARARARLTIRHISNLVVVDVCVGAVGDVNGDGDGDALEEATAEHVAIAVAVKVHDHVDVHGM